LVVVRRLALARPATTGGVSGGATGVRRRRLGRDEVRLDSLQPQCQAGGSHASWLAREPGGTTPTSTLGPERAILALVAAAVALVTACCWAGVSRAQVADEAVVTSAPSPLAPTRDDARARSRVGHGPPGRPLCRASIGCGADETPAAGVLPDLVPALSLVDRGLDDSMPTDLRRDIHGLAQASGAGKPADGPGAAPSAEQQQARGYSPREITDPVPFHSSINRQPTYQQNRGGGGKSYVKLKALLVLEAGLPLISRVEWPIPEVDWQNGSATSGIGDLTWLNLFLVGKGTAWGKVAVGPVLVFPTASPPDMGQGKYQVGPALGYVNDAVHGWQFALLVQQFFSFAGDPARAAVNQLQIQPFVTKYLGESWYLQSQPIITVNFEQGTSSVPLNFVVGKVVDRRWDFNLQVSLYPRWTSPPTKDYEVIVNIGYHFPALFSRRRE
jgi:hypothetical protein